MRFHASGLRLAHGDGRAAWCLRALVCGLVLLALGGPPSTSALAQGVTNYVVQPGDSLGYIASTSGTTVQAIIDANGLASRDSLWVGQSLAIPVRSSGTPAANGNGSVYTVQLGDTLNSIAASLGVDAAALAQANNLTNPDQLWIGQPLLVPGRSLGSAAAAPAPARAALAGRYVVQPGDTLNGIAASLGVTTAALLAANNLDNADLLAVGQTLIVPGGGPAEPLPGPAPTARPTAPPATADTAAEPGTAAPDATATPAPIATPPGSYIVQPGDTVAAIAGKLGVSGADLIRTNKLANPDRLAVGQKLVVPGAPTAAPDASPAAAEAAQPAADSLPGPLAPVATTPTPPPGPQHYTVQPGETLGIIAKRFGTTAAAIARANQITSLDMLGVGRDLLIPAPDWTSPGIAGGKPSRFVASISQQHCWLYRANAMVASWTCSTGRPGSASRPGSYKIQSKLPKAFGSTWNIWMPYWLGIYWAGGSENGIHGIPTKAGSKEVLWDGLVGTPITFGCIMLDQAHAKQLYDLAYIGMPVIIQP